MPSSALVRAGCKADLLTGRDRKRAKSQQLGLGRRKNDPLAPRRPVDPGVITWLYPLWGYA